MRQLLSRATTLVLAAVFASAPLTATAAGTTAAVAGVVHASNGAPLGGAQVQLIGPSRLSMTTDAQGKFNFPEVPTGLYTLQVVKAGYNVYRNDSIAAFIGETFNADVTLVQSSFTSLKTIASVSTTEAGVAQINTSTAAIDTISGATFSDQGSTQVTKVLNETPGLFTTPYSPNNGNPSNGASPGSAQTPQIRGALPYETESLIDGHPVSVGSVGTFSPTLINPFLLQDVEVVKGPGSMPVEINYAVNGTVNYITLQPTATNQSSGMYGVDKWGGISAGFKATGETKNQKLGYAIGYVTDGAPGPLENIRFEGSQIPLDAGPPGGPYYVNGQQLAMLAPVGEGLGPKGFAPYDGMGIVFNEPLTGCCYTMDTGYHATSELGKLLYNFSNNTSFQVSYLGGQSVTGNGDVEAYDTSQVAGTGLPAFSFQPCGSASQAITCNPFATGGSYSCTTPSGPACGTAIPFDLSSFNGLGYTWEQQNLFQGEFRTTLGQTGTVLARYYTGSLNTFDIEGQSEPLNLRLNAYGTVPLCPSGTAFDPVPPPAAGGPSSNPNGYMCVTSGGSAVAPVNTTFDGQNVDLETASQANLVTTNDTMNGESFQLQEQLGEHTFTLAYDRSEQGSSSIANEPSVGIVVKSPVPGSSQTFQTFSLRGNIVLRPKLLLNLADYDLNYLSHYSINGGSTWNGSTHSYNEPRAALSWRPSNDTIYRLSAGGSVAPPYISLISSGGTSWSQIIGGVPAAGWVQDANSGNINAETAFSYDLGADHRITRSTAVTFDLYATQLHNMFFTQTSTVTGAAAAGCPNAPCEVQATQNLGQARYQGIELGLNHTPLFGLGWKLQGSLERAYTYNLPPYFYCAGSVSSAGKLIPPGPGCVYNTNLAILPNVNFGGEPTAISGAPNGVAGARVPYSTGYAEINWLGHYEQYYSVGLQYFGNNNSFNEPAFTVLSANARFKLNDSGTKLQISADNLTGAYANPYAGFFNGIPLPLVKGATQTSLTTGQPVPVYYTATPAGNYGPVTYRIIVTQDF